MTKKEWYKNRILWKAKQHKLFEKSCLLFNVDDYEDECISDKDKQLEVIHAIEQIKINFDREKLILLDKLINLFKEAISRNTGIYFFSNEKT